MLIEKIHAVRGTAAATETSREAASTQAPCAGWLESLIGVQVLRGIVFERAEAIARRINDKLREGDQLSEFEDMVMRAAVRFGCDTRYWQIEAA